MAEAATAAVVAARAAVMVVARAGVVREALMEGVAVFEGL